MRHYTQLTQEQRYQMHAFMKAGFTKKHSYGNSGTFIHSQPRDQKKSWATGIPPHPGPTKNTLLTVALTS